MNQQLMIVIALTGMCVLLVGVVVGVLVANHRTRVRKQRDLLIAFGGSLEAAADSLDKDRIRSIRDTRGELHAVREVQKALPILTLEQQVQVVRSL